LAPWESALSSALVGDSVSSCSTLLIPSIQTTEELHPPDMLTHSCKLESKVPLFWSICVQGAGVEGLYVGYGMMVASIILCSGIVFVIYDWLSQRF
ncbi:hypothetical protein EDB19DRAFT_1597334, partial [Suillus lakei]